MSKEDICDVVGGLYGSFNEGLKKDIVIRAGEKLLAAPNIVRRSGKWYSIIIGIGKDHHAELVIDGEALSVLNG